ncbi:MAG: hypothetical protein KAT39_03390 [Alphaproteobacteria bacterium]|nr:hypothetical protein [Alphaproteobacteria bacterium]
MSKDALATTSTKEAADRFAVAAKRYASQATRTEKSARKTLVKLGIYTKKGNLTARYK